MSKLLRAAHICIIKGYPDTFVLISGRDGVKEEKVLRFDLFRPNSSSEELISYKMQLS